MKTCSVEKCEGKHYAHSFCYKHYKKYRKYGNPLESKLESHKMARTPIYSIWCAMKQRCYYEKHKRIL